MQLLDRVQPLYQPVERHADWQRPPVGERFPQIIPQLFHAVIPVFYVLQTKTVDDKLPRHSGLVPGYSGFGKETIAVRVYRVARAIARADFHFAFGCAPSKKLVEPSRLPRPPPKGESPRIKKAGRVCHHLTGRIDRPIPPYQKECRYAQRS